MRASPANLTYIESRRENTDTVAFIKNLLLGLWINPAKLASMSASWPTHIARGHRCLRGEEALSWVEICDPDGIADTSFFAVNLFQMQK